jgi:hypothetical protein
MLTFPGYPVSKGADPGAELIGGSAVEIALRSLPPENAGRP